MVGSPSNGLSFRRRARFALGKEKKKLHQRGPLRFGFQQGEILGPINGEVAVRGKELEPVAQSDPRPPSLHGAPSLDGWRRGEAAGTWSSEEREKKKSSRRSARKILECLSEPLSLGRDAVSPMI